MRVIGITCGIGSMLVGARDAGFEVLGNVEWRRYYHQRDEEGRNTFEANFPGVPYPFKAAELSPEDEDRMTGVELAMGHPECGNFSSLSSSNPNRAEKLMDPADIPLFVELVNRFKPRFFVMDDLPKSFMAFPMREYAERLPDYDLFPEWVSNWGYGNVQRMRNRMFMVGALKSEGFAFMPGEVDHDLGVRDIIGDLPDPQKTQVSIPNHDPHVLDDTAAKGHHLLYRGHRATWREIQEYFAEAKGGKVIGYVGEGDMPKSRPGTYLGHWDKHGHVLDGGSPALHSLRRLPYTIRERARIQGFPDDFVFYGTKKNEDGTWNHDKNLHMVKQTGKAMPIQFCRFVAQQVYAHLKGEEFECSGERIAKRNEYVDKAKRWYCLNVGYGNQEKACDACWMREECEIRSRVYGIGDAPDAHEPVPMDPTDMYGPETESSEERPQAPKKAKQKAKPARRVRTSRFQERGNDPRKTTIQGGGEHHEG